ncbi:hypothetical protein N7478_002329 [Penicillium angulare]|uniref:uncharacterized protein n=1 Tax=Penicillium angulare TaxID=116970 RepID=UPI0025423ECD|nr:uncharacterized protein N7478_002329 [Penicillium angulare]KAJ5286643.1 hypothetical protein N7478_002329 [Penicillium angulare]
MGTQPASPQAQACDLSHPAADTNFSFTPIKALRALPRLWERKPATPFQAGPKSRKLWKRVATSFTTMKSIDSTSTMQHDPFQAAINSSRDASYVRGVKRRCVGSAEPENRPMFQMQDSGRSFLETKWEADTSRHRRKMAEPQINIFDESKENGQSDLAMTGSPQPLSSLRSPLKTTVFNDEIPVENMNTVSDVKSIDSPRPGSVARQPCMMIGNAGNNQDEQMAPTPTKVVRDSNQQQKGSLVRTALRSSLDGSDTELLNDFLSKAAAKRAAKAAQDTQENDSNENSSSSEESPEIECATPPSRRALGALDTNSPSPIKLVVPSPIKQDENPDEELQENQVIKKDILDEDLSPASPTCRRSSRVKATPAPATARNTISLRRAQGNEFVFLQRTEVQEIALATKKNTRQNRGDAVLPKFRLEALAKEHTDGPSETEVSTKRRSPARKSLKWNEDHLIEFEDERQTSEDPVDSEGHNSKNDVGGTTRSRSTAQRPEKKASSQRKSRSQVQDVSNNDETDSTPSAPAPAAQTDAPTRSRRVHSLGKSTLTSGTPVKTGSGRISKPPAPSAPTATATGPSTPTKPRRKLVPKSPSSSLLTAPPAKNGVTTSDPSFVSGIPTRSASLHAGSSEGTKRKSMLQASAGCTPMPRRVRARS